MKFSEWLNENEKAPKKAAAFKVGDQVIYNGNDGTAQLGYSKNRTRVYGPALCEVKKISTKGSSWIYSLEILEGMVLGYARVSRGSAEYLYSGGDLESPQKDLSTDDVKKFLDIIKDAPYKRHDKVTYRDKTCTISHIAISETLKTGKVNYKLKTKTGEYSRPIDIAGFATPDDLTSEIEYGSEEKEIISEEIFKFLKIDTEERDNDYDLLKIKTLELKDLGKIAFRSKEDGEKFIEDLKKFINSRTEKDLQIVCDYQLNSPSINNYSVPTMKKSRILEVARKLKINIQELLNKKRGRIGAKKLGIL